MTPWKRRSPPHWTRSPHRSLVTASATTATRSNDSAKCSRLLEVIGEAANGVSEKFREEQPALPWRQMIATRNRLIHGYRDIDAAVVANIAQSNLPVVISALEPILEQSCEIDRT